MERKLNYSGSGIFFFFCQRKRAKNEMLHKRVFRKAFWVVFFRNVLTFSQWNGKNGFRLNAFFVSKTFFETFLTFSQWNGKTVPIKRVFLSENVRLISINLLENVLKRLADQHRLQKTLSIGDRNWAKCVRENSKSCLLGWIKSIK